jgi:hypothetical protein
LRLGRANGSRPFGDQAHQLGGVEADRGSETHDGKLSALYESLHCARVDVERVCHFTRGEQSDPG